jgi:hypothetical protein
MYQNETEGEIFSIRKEPKEKRKYDISEYLWRHTQILVDPDVAIFVFPLRLYLMATSGVCSFSTIITSREQENR